MIPLSGRTENHLLPISHRLHKSPANTNMIVSSSSRRNNKQMEIYNIRSEIWSEHNNNNEQKQKKTSKVKWNI